MSSVVTIDRSHSDIHPGAAALDRSVAFIAAGWHADIVAQCRDGFSSEMRKQGVRDEQLYFFEVPGAFEIPLMAKRLARTGRYAAVIASAFVVDGGIYRHEFVANAVIDALMRLQIETEVPVISAVLTPHHFHEHEEHKAFFKQHFRVKGMEAAVACLRIVQVQAEIVTAGG